MTRDSFIHQNIQLLQKIDSKLAYQLMFSDPSPLEFCETDKGELNLKRTYEGQTYEYHSPKGALEEAQRWFQNLKLESTSTLFIYGIGLGYYYEAAKYWLEQDPKRHLVFLEEDLGVLYRLMETKTGFEILKNPRIKIFTFTNLLDDKERFSEFAWYYVFSPFAFSALKLYQEVNAAGCQDLHHQIAHEIMQKRAFADEYLHFGTPFFRNFYPNLMDIDQSYLGNQLFGQFQNTPAIICGAGPSLNRNIDLLKTVSEQALILAGSSALPALISKKIIPHFGVAIDPNQTQLKRVQSVKGLGVPFFYRNRLFHDALKAIDGPRLYLTGTGGYPISEWFEEQLGIEGEELDEGHNVVNFCLDIARALGCNPIILVGVDLAFTDGVHYAQGVLEVLQLKEEEFIKNEDFDSQPILKKDIYGNPIYTLWKWVTEADWIARFAENHSTVKFINATEGGIGFEGIPNETLAQVKQKYLQKDLNVRERIAVEIQKNPLRLPEGRRVFELVQAFRASVERCLGYLKKLWEEMDRLAKEVEEGKHFGNEVETPTSFLIEMNIQEEIGYQYLLDVFNTVYVKCHQREIEELRINVQDLPQNVIRGRKIRMQQERLQFLHDVAQANIALIDWASRVSS